MAPTKTTPSCFGSRFAVGLTGGIGSGKSTVADMFAARGAAVIDTDLISHSLTAPGGHAIEPIRQRFGDKFIMASGAMDRARMRDLVFENPEARKALESILHPLIRRETEKAAVAAQGDYLILVVPLLVESGEWRQRVSRVLVVDCPETLQIARVMNRNDLPEEQVKTIIAAQASRETRLAAADDVVQNDRDQAELEPQVERLHTLYRSLAGSLAGSHGK